MNNFLSKLKPDTRVNVGVSVSPNVGLEMIVVDVVQHKVLKYACRTLSYNFPVREIEDYRDFKQTLQDLFNELRLNPKDCNVVLNLPSVFFGHKFLPTVLDDEGINTALIAEVEQNYLFKKNTPVVSWVDIKENNTSERRYLLYSAIQEGVVDVIKTIFSELGASLVAIENSYAALLRAFDYTEVAKDFALSHTSWNILLVMSNSYAIFSMLGNNVIEYFEEPLATKSFSNDEVYVAISQAATRILDKYPSDKLLIASESNDVSAEILAIQMKHPGDVIFLDCNLHIKQQIIDVDLNVLPHYVKAITPEAIGVGIYKLQEPAIKFNFLKDTDVKSQETVNVYGFELTKEQLSVYSLLIGGLILALCFAVSFVIGIYLSNLEKQNSFLSQEISIKKAELAKLKKASGVIDIYAAAKKLDKNMITKLSYYESIGSDIPSDVWVTYFYADTDGASAIKGETTSVDDVYLFFRSIKSRVSDSDLILSKLSVDDQGGIIDIEKAKNATYSFELTNSSFSKVKVVNPNNPAEIKVKNGTAGKVSVPNLPNLPQ